MDLNERAPEEEAIWKGVQNGNHASFELLYSRYFKVLYSYGRKVCSNPTILEDAIHDLFVDIWRYHANLSPTTSIRFYLYRALRRKIVKNEAKDIEASLFDFKAGNFFSEKSSSPEDEIIQSERSNERSHKLNEHLKSLPARQYESLILRFYDEFSYEEIGELLGVNEQSARNLVQRGLKQFKTLIKALVIVFAAFVHFLASLSLTF